MTRLNVGDWVSFCFAFECEKKEGHIVQIHKCIQKATIQATNGQTYLMNISSLNKIPARTAPKYTQDDLRALIDVALDVKDRQWFEEITSELKRIQEVAD